MLGLMQDWPLLLHTIIDHAAIQHGTRELVTRSLEGAMHRTTYAAVRTRALRGADRLATDGIVLGDRVATLAWNTWRHVEAWYAITGLGAICHTVNPRLFPEQIAWILSHATPRVLMLDVTFVPLVEALLPQLSSIERFILFCEPEALPATRLPGAIAYEAWLAEGGDGFTWPRFDEGTAAGLCYTSGTTGPPRGILYSHRSNMLHAMQACAADSFAPRAQDNCLVVVPMFHANAWALAYALPMAGAKMVLPGARLDGPSLFDLMDAEDVTLSAGVPTIWMGLLAEMKSRGRKPHALRRLAVGGSACPRSMIECFERDFGIDVFHAWGMTETSPVASVGTLKPAATPRSPAAVIDAKVAQGYAPYGVEMIVTDDEGRVLPWDGVTFGRLKVRGPCVARRYYGETGDALDADGYFDTGDIATIDADGTMRITDRAKDVIKSGGEWISSIEIENLVMGHPDVAEAAVIGLPHARWAERPLLVVVSAPGRAPTAAALLAFLDGKIARWWMPDDVAFVADLPHTAAGKLDKRGLRARFVDHRWPDGRRELSARAVRMHNPPNSSEP